MEERKEFSNRGQHLNFSKIGGGKGCSVIISIFLIAWGVGLIFLLQNGHKLEIPKLIIPVYIFSTLLVLGGFGMLLRTQKKASSYFNKDFSEHQVLKRARIPNIFWMFMFLIFAIMFIFVGFNEAPFLIGGLIFFALVIVGIYGMVKSEKRIKATKMFGSTQLRSYSVFNLGNIIEVTILNKSEAIQLQEIRFVLRFVEEEFVSKNPNSRKKSSSLKVFYSQEQDRYAVMQDGTVSVEFELPMVDARPTNMDFKEPKYWELECSNESINYFARFVLDVK